MQRRSFLTAVGALAACLVLDRVPKLPPTTRYRQAAKNINFSRGLQGVYLMITHDELTLEVPHEHAREIAQRLRHDMRDLARHRLLTETLRGFVSKATGKITWLDEERS